MNDILRRFATTPIEKGFVKGFVNDDTIYELIVTYIGNKDWVGIIQDDLETASNSCDVIQILTDEIYIPGSEIIEIADEEDGIHTIVYDFKGTYIAFMSKKNWTIAFWKK